MYIYIYTRSNSRYLNTKNSQFRSSTLTRPGVVRLCVSRFWHLVFFDLKFGEWTH